MMSDEPLLQDFFSSLSDRSSYKRFASAKRHMPRSRLWEFLPLDPSRGLVILALLVQEHGEELIGLGQFCTNDSDLFAELALVVHDDFQGQGIGGILHRYMTYLGRRKGLKGFTAEVLEDNLPALGLITRMGFRVAGEDGGTLQMRMLFDEDALQQQDHSLPG
jgi:RimJ/RimL family protein N-acetyltransferase